MNDSDMPTVLVVEDEPAVADFFEMMLQGECEVLTAASGSAALELLPTTWCCSTG